MVDQFVPLCKKNDIDIHLKIALYGEWPGYAKDTVGYQNDFPPSIVLAKQFHYRKLMYF